MEARLVEFAEVLRQNGVRVGPGELEDAARATLEVGLTDRTLFKSALAATLVKRDRDVPAFDRAFEFFFTGTAATFAALDRSLAQRIRERGLLEGDELTMVLATLGQQLGGMSPLGQAMGQGDTAALSRIFRGAMLELDLSRYESFLQTGFFSRRMMLNAGIEPLRADLKTLEQELAARGLSAEGLEIVSRELADALREVEDAARKALERQGKARQRPRDGRLADKPFATYSPREVTEAKTAVRRLAERLKSRWTRKKTRKRRGTLSVQRTLRKNLGWGGVPMAPAFRSRRPQRPEVVVLCDVSDSVRNTSRLMLLFMHTLQSLYSRVRSFVFVSELGEVTRLFREREVDDAIEAAVSGEAVSLTANSNYGRAFSRFARDELGSITRRTTVLVIGDGRNNYNPSGSAALTEIAQKARRVLWICPEAQASWGIGDSEMRSYAQRVNQVLVVQSLEDLGRVADKLVT